MKNKLLFTLITTTATLVVTHPTININLMPDAVIYTKTAYEKSSGYCKLEKSFTDMKGLQVCEYKCSGTKRNDVKIIHTTSLNGARSCKDKIESP
jgi:hypothetical protein